MDNKIKAEKIVEIINNERGIKAEISIKINNGVESIGITLGDDTVRPTIYPDFNSTNDMNKIIDKLIDSYEKVKADNPHKEFEDIINHFTDFDFVKGGIIPCLVRFVQDELVQRDYLDLKVMYRFVFDNASIAIKKEHLKMWDITEEKLFEIAKDNVYNLFVDKSMGEALGAPALDEFEIMRVITTKDGLYGASALLFPELFAEYGNETTILPSSIHEVIVLLADATQRPGTRELVDMITSINSADVAPEEVLSNHPYTYVDGKIRG